ncbi:geranylgeranyl pyrophosphate synthase [Holotrichia oblita]|uniref:Geranylgeranyl pyrophosphate synthase n=1 Tax=Holotrichia oblita TaxID=644536 RepID=A0ACB9TE31_HOLOL|nr:geranylgeranyl pyrophosphate synthase [Holotrichia oblita]
MAGCYRIIKSLRCKIAVAILKTWSNFARSDSNAYVDDIDVHEIYIEPPDANILTNEDSGEEDGGGLLDNVSGRQLLLNAELVFRSAVTVDEAEPEDILVRPSNGSGRNNVFLRPGLEKITWIQGDFDGKTRSFSESDYSKYEKYVIATLLKHF